MVKVAIIGVSGFGAVIYNNLLPKVEAGEAEFTAAAIINQDEEKEKCEKLRSLGCRIFDDYKVMLKEMADELDICFIPTGIHMHMPMTVDALEAGVNVAVEKPITATIQDALKIQDAEKRTGKFVAVDYQHMYPDSTLIVKKKLLSGELGKVKKIKTWVKWPRTHAYYTRNNWAGKLKIGDHWVLDSPFNNANAHQLNLMCFFAGTELEKSADIETVEAELYRANDIESADTAAIRATSSNGIEILFFLSHCSNANSGPEMTIICEKGEISWTFEETVISSDKGREVFSNECDKFMEISVGKILNKVNDPSSFACSSEIAAVQTLCVNGIHESSKVNKIDERYIEEMEYDNSTSKVIKELDAVIDSAFTEEKLFSELGVEWAVKGKKINMKNYKSFPAS